MSAPVRVGLIDDHQIVRSGFSQIISFEKEFEVVAESSSLSEARTMLETTPLDLIVLDLSLPDGSGLDFLKYLSTASYTSKVIVLSMYDTEPFVTKALSLGACAFLSKRTASDDIVKAMNVVLDGDKFLSPDVVVNMELSEKVKIDSGLSNLTEREKDVFLLFAKGKCAKDVSRIKDIAIKTAHAHKRNILEKLGCFNSFELTQIALKAQLITVDDLL